MRLRFKPSIANTIFALAGLLIALMAIVAALNTALSLRVGDSIGAVNRIYVPAYGMLARAHIRSLEQSLALRQAAIEVLSGRPAAVDDLLRREKAASDSFLKEVGSARTLLQSNDGGQAANAVLLGRLQVRLETVTDLRARYDAARSAFLAALDQRDSNAIRAALQDLDALREEQNTHLEDTRREALSYASAAVETTQESGREVIRLTLVTLALAILLGFLGAFWIARRMVTSIRRLVAATEAVEQGRYDAELPVTSKDEIGRLTRSFNLMIAELRLKEKIRATFGRYLDPQVVSGLLDAPEAATGGERRRMTILFADMAGFSHLSEEVSPGLLVTVLNRYLSTLTQAVRERRGVLDKYLGDGAMAFWGPPFVESEAQAKLACEAALLQIRRFADFRAELPDLLGVKSSRPALGLRIGIASGDVIAGNVGSQEAMNYTVLGDPVNIAARLEKLNKRYGTAILVSDETAALLGTDAVLREVDRVTVTGRDGSLAVYELIAMSGGEADPARDGLLDGYARALEAYRARDWDAAAKSFRSCLDLAPGDGPSRTMLARCERLSAEPPADWDGIWRATEG